MTTVGISGMKIYLPKPRVRLSDWCGWTGANPSKIEAVIGRSFRMLAPEESIYTMAADAVLQLIDDYEIDPTKVGYLGFGTESSTDNSAGAVVIKGMIDGVLRNRGKEPMSRHCEVPEYKHACLGGVYALKGALRYLAQDGEDRVAIVVCGDVAEYARGSSGEPTQGAGVVAMLVECDPKMLAIDLRKAGSASSYRGPDFRKPVRRHFADNFAADTEKHHDFPVFSGKYSTVCYVDETLRAAEHMFSKTDETPVDYYRRIESIFFHRPYRKMPIDAFAALYVWGMAGSEEHHERLATLCAEVGADKEALLAETQSRPDLFTSLIKTGRQSEEIYPAAIKVARYLRKTPEFAALVTAKLGLGAETAMDFGNLYTASLPAWMAAGFHEAVHSGRELSGKSFLALGYGSGDAAEVIPFSVCEGWRVAAERMRIDQALKGAYDLSREQYEQLHDKGTLEAESYQPKGFVVDRIGGQNEADFQDVGVEYYEYV